MGVTVGMMAIEGMIAGKRPVLRLPLAALLFLVLGFLGGCGTQVEVWEGEGHDTSRGTLSFQTLVLEVNSDLPGVEEAVKALDFALGTEFLYRHKRVVKSGGDIRVAVKIRHFKEVARESRVWLGSLAGSAELMADVRVTGRQVKPFTFSIEARSHGASTREDFLTGKGGSTEDLTQRVAAIIVGELVDPSS